jgi:6-phosphogluconolactonase
MFIKSGSFADGTNSLRLFIGTYTHQDGRGIYTSRFAEEHGTLEVPRLVWECDNPTFLALHPSKPYLYAIGKFPTGMLRAFHYDKQDGCLELLNEQEIPGHGPCHLTVCPSDAGDAVVVANYGSGSVASFPILNGGNIGKVASHITHTGSGPNTARQQTPHVHGVYSDGSTIAVVDLGIDRVVYYHLDPATAELSQPADNAYLHLAPGAGPRHLAVSNDKRFIYVVNELDSTVSVFDRQRPHHAIQSVSTLTDEKDIAERNNTAAEIALHPSGNFLYVSNRGDDSIAVFSLEAGMPMLIQSISSGGKTPRFFCLGPTGQFLLVCNQDSGNICVFAVYQTTGMLIPTDQCIHVSQPACFVFGND